MIIIASIAGFIGIFGLFAAVNVEEQALLPVTQKIDVAPSDAA